MKCSEAKLSELLIASKKVRNGNIHFFENFLVVEIDEGTVVDFNNSEDIVNHINHYFADGKPFGLIVNRIHSYSVNLAEVHRFNSLPIKPVASAVVYYSTKSINFLDVENQFWFSKRQRFENLNLAEAWILNQLKYPEDSKS